MAKVNRLARDTRNATAKARKALEALGKISFRHDDSDLAMAAGKLADAVLFLNGAADKFERRGGDYATPAAEPTVPDLVGFLSGSGKW